MPCWVAIAPLMDSTTGWRHTECTGRYPKTIRSPHRSITSAKAVKGSIVSLKARSRWRYPCVASESNRKKLCPHWLTRRRRPAGLRRHARASATCSVLNNGTRGRSAAQHLDYSLAMSVIQDLRLATRVLLRQKLFSAIVVGTIGTAIGANIAVFQVLDITMLRPLPFAAAERLVRVRSVLPRAGGASVRAALSPQAFARIRDTRIFEGLVAQRVTSLVLRAQADPERVVGIEVSEGWAALLGVAPVAGRVFTTEE